MPNMAVQYRGPNPALLTLTKELRARFGDPARTYEFVTGYKSPGNYSGHNPDNNGIVHAVDIFTDDHGNIPEAEGRALAERLRLVGAATNRFAYLIHDMSAGAPQPMIAGQHTNWLWAAYGGADAHSDHIHLSIADGYWGDPCTVPAYITNDTSRWGVTGGVTPAAGTITPIIPKEDTLSAAEVNTILNAIGDKAAEVKKYTADLLIYEYQTGGRVHPGIGRVVEENQRRVNTANAKIAALETVVGQLAKNQGVALDYKKIDASIKSALADGIEITGTILAKDGTK